MDNLLLGKCWYCGHEIPYQDGASMVKCPSCGESLVVAEFLNEQIRIRKALEEGKQAEEKLKAAEKAKRETEEKLLRTISEISKANASHAHQEELLEQLQQEQKRTGSDLTGLIKLAEALQTNQENSDDFLRKLYSKIAEGQDSAEEAFSTLLNVTDALRSAGDDLQNRADGILAFIRNDAAEKKQWLEELNAWLQKTHQEDDERLARISEACSELSRAGEIRDRNIRELKDEVSSAREAVKSFQSKWEQSKLDRIVALFHQGEGRQFDRLFDKAEDYYRQAIIAGGNDPEVYWRIVLCHYCVEYQVDNEGNRIPCILYPDLTDPSEIADRKDLEASYQTEEQRRYYTRLLGTIDRILDKYRELRSQVQYDVFISVKQRDEGKYTVDCGKAYELYQYLKDELGLRVFNSEHTRPPAGQEFEPYILSALLSSRVMIVVGSKKEYMEAQWVRNEWSRFKWLQKYEKQNEGGSKRLLFGYLVQGMKAGMMPKALADIQAIEEGVYAKDQLKEAMLSTFKIAIPEQDSIDKVLSNWSNWLRLGRFERIKSDYDKLVDQGLYMEYPRLHLYALCADYKLSDISQLPDGVRDLTGNNKFILACECAQNDEDKALLKDLKQRFGEGLEQRKKKNKRRTVFLTLLAAAAALIVLLLILILPALTPEPAIPTSEPAADAVEQAAQVPEPTTPTPEPETPTPEPETPTPEPATPTPEPETPTPEPETPTPEPATPTPKPATPTPEPETPTPEPETPTPEPKTPTPKPATPTPKPATPTPKPATPTPKPATPTPKPATPTPEPATAEAPIVRPMDILTFGTLKGEPIEWIVLETGESQGGKYAVLLSRSILAESVYHGKYSKVRWETCELRGALNQLQSSFSFSNEFYRMQYFHWRDWFSTGEQGRLLSGKVLTDGTETEDTIWLMSEQEYLHWKDSIIPLLKGDAPSLKHYGEYYEGWWLRDSGSKGSRAKYVDSANTVQEMAVDSNSGVRPVIRISLNN